MTMCKECIKQGRYSKSNLTIDLREVKHVLETRPNIMASEYIDLCYAKNQIVKKLLDKSLECNCK